MRLVAAILSDDEISSLSVSVHRKGSGFFRSQSQGGGQQPDGRAVDTSISLFVPEPPGRASGQWWPAELGLPNGSGSQNQVRYAYFNAAHRLAVELNGHVTAYDSLDRQIGGVSQQLGSGGSLTLTSQLCQWTACPATHRHPRLHRKRNPPTPRRPRKPTFSPRSNALPTLP
jgi:hypothetical protein